MLTALIGMFISAADLFAQQDKIDVFPAVPYDRFIVYQNLITFWVGIIGLIVIIKMKLREIERTQKLGIDKEEKDIPVLD
jgi:branched-subunit amino acid permease